MKKTILNNINSYTELRERLNTHFSSLDPFRQDRYSSIEEAFIEGYKNSMNQELERKEKRRLLKKAYSSIVYFNKEKPIKWTVDLYSMLRNIAVGLHLTKNDNENYIFAILDSSLSIMIESRVNNKEYFYYIARDTLYYLMDYLFDKRVYTSSDEEIKVLNNFFMLFDYELKDEFKNIQQSEHLSEIIDLYLTMGAYCHINEQYDLFDSRKNQIAVAVLSVKKDDYESKIVAAYHSLIVFENYKDFKLKDELLAKKKELGGEE